MKVVCAPDSFKESMSDAEAAAAMTRGVRSVFPDAQCVEVPMADGGEGTTEALVDALGGEWREVATVDALGRPITARYGLAPAPGERSTRRYDDRQSTPPPARRRSHATRSRRAPC